MASNPAQTFDTILGGSLSIVQPSSGYRFAIDSILLARFAQPRPRARILELGAGCGVVAVMLAALHQPAELVAIEIQPKLATMIRENAAFNGVPVNAVCADLRQRNLPGIAPAAFDYIVANPPYRAPNSGRESPDPDRQVARGAGGAALDDFLAAAARYGGHGARVAIVFTAARTAELVAGLKRRSLEPKRIRFVHPLPGEPANLILLEARKGGGVEATIESPLFLYKEPRVYSDEARALMGSER